MRPIQSSHPRRQCQPCWSSFELVLALSLAVEGKPNLSIYCVCISLKYEGTTASTYPSHESSHTELRPAWKWLAGPTTLPSDPRRMQVRCHSQPVAPQHFTWELFLARWCMQLPRRPDLLEARVSKWRSGPATRCDSELTNLLRGGHPLWRLFRCRHHFLFVIAQRTEGLCKGVRLMRAPRWWGKLRSCNWPASESQRVRFYLWLCTSRFAFRWICWAWGC